MNIKVISAPIMILSVVLAQIMIHAQSRSTDNAIRIGGTPTQKSSVISVSPNPVQGMTTPPIQGMTTPPIAPMGGGVAVQQMPGVYPQVLMGSFIGTTGNNFAVLPPGGTIFVPAGTTVVESGPGQQPGTYLTAPATPEEPASPKSPQGSRGGGTSIQRTSRTDGSSQKDVKAAASEPEPSRLALGTPRDKVIEKYGNPVAYIMNMNGETLYFKDGVVVFVKDGVVSTPGN